MGTARKAIQPVMVSGLIGGDFFTIRLLTAQPVALQSRIASTHQAGMVGLPESTATPHREMAMPTSWIALSRSFSTAIASSMAIGVPSCTTIAPVPASV